MSTYTAGSPEAGYFGGDKFGIGPGLCAHGEWRRHVSGSAGASVRVHRHQPRRLEWRQSVGWRGGECDDGQFKCFHDLLPGKWRRHVHCWAHTASFSRDDSGELVLILVPGFIWPGKHKRRREKSIWFICLRCGFYGPGGVAGYFLATGNGDGSFNTPVFVQAPNVSPRPAISTITRLLSNLFVADVNGDGKADLIYSYSVAVYQTNTYEQGIAVQLSNGDGTFQAPQVIQTYSSTTAPTGQPPQFRADLAMRPGAANWISSLKQEQLIPRPIRTYTRFKCIWATVTAPSAPH